MLYTMCRFWMVNLTTGHVMSIALAFACGKSIAVTCLIPILALRTCLLLSSVRSDYNFQIEHSSSFICDA